MKELTKPQTLKDVKEFSSIITGEYIPSSGRRIVMQFDILPNAVFYRKDTFVPQNTKNLKKITRMGHVSPREMCDLVNRVLQSANSRIKGVYGYTGGITLHGQKVTPNGSKLFGDLPEIPRNLKKLLKLDY